MNITFKCIGINSHVQENNIQFVLKKFQSSGTSSVYVHKTHTYKTCINININKKNVTAAV